MVTVIDRTRLDSASSEVQDPVSPAEHLRAKQARGGLYKARTPIYPKLVHGRWRNLKWALLIVTLVIYYVTPWLRWVRPAGMPQQAVLVDFDHARFYAFGIELWPQEFYLVTGLLVLSALALFLVTALFGRLWCGYSCPQTVWTDLFIHVERLFEGDRNARMRLDAAPWSFDKLWRKTGKHMVWLGVAFGTGGAWIFYFRDAPTLLREFWTGQAPVTSYISCALLTATTYVFAGTMREQVCTYMCPWPRIQGAMLDKHSLQVTYRYDRGEPRGRHKKGEAWSARGGCVDCKQCVTVCPMGIDIRNGPQLECINCGLCADACDQIMRRIERPSGLIGYDTDAAVLARSKGEAPVYRLLRGRTAYYALALSVVGGLTLWGLLTRPKLDLHVIRDRSPMFVRMQDGSVRNGYTLQIANHALTPSLAVVHVEGLDQAWLRTPGAAASQNALRVELPADQKRSVRIFVTGKATGGDIRPLRIRLDTSQASASQTTTFFTGAAQ